MSVQQCTQYAKSGKQMRIKRIVASHPSARKLKSMGLDEGCDIRMERVSPFGDPCMITVKGYSLALRRRDLDALDLEITADTGA